MPKTTTRRKFFSTLALITATPVALAKHIIAEEPQPLSVMDTEMLEKLTHIDSDFIAIDGWVLPIKSMTLGES